MEKMVNIYVKSVKTQHFVYQYMNGSHNIPFKEKISNEKEDP